MRTGDNDRFLRRWYEVSFNTVKLFSRNSEEAKNSGMTWFPYQKGGGFRRWYGNLEYVVNWHDDGYEIKRSTLENYPQLSWDNLGWKISNERYYFKKAITWTATSSSYFGVRFSDEGFLFDVKGSFCTPEEYDILPALGLLGSSFTENLIKVLNPTIEVQPRDVANVPFWKERLGVLREEMSSIVEELIDISREDWNSQEVSWGFRTHPLVSKSLGDCELGGVYGSYVVSCQDYVERFKNLESLNNRLVSEAYNVCNSAIDVPAEKVTLIANPLFRYGEGVANDLANRFRCDSAIEVISYALGCIMGRYSLDKPGLILASQGETIHDYLAQIPEPSFTPDKNAIIPLTDQEWFPDDATNRFRDFVRTVWGEEHLQENLDFVAESLCLHAIKPKKSEAALETIRRYLSTQFYKDHLRTYKKRPIYWLFSSGKQKAFECLVYLHRYNESTLAEMRTDYVIPLTTKLAGYVEKLEQDKENSTSAAEAKGIEKELSKLYKQQAELNAFDEKLRHYADQRISLDLDDGVKVNYGKFGDLLAEVKQVAGKI